MAVSLSSVGRRDTAKDQDEGRRCETSAGVIKPLAQLAVALAALQPTEVRLDRDLVSQPDQDWEPAQPLRALMGNVTSGTMTNQQREKIIFSHLTFFCLV